MKLKRQVLSTPHRMHLLVITNLFPPQELGGYGRCMADFAWGLEQRGHRITVLSSDAPYLPQPLSDVKLNASVNRSLLLKGDFRKGVHHLTDPQARHEVDVLNHKTLEQILVSMYFDGVLLGNLDLLGPEVLTALMDSTMPVLHHIGFVAPPFARGHYPTKINYRLIAASQAVKTALTTHNVAPSETIKIVYPGARCDIYSNERRSLPAPLGTEISTPHRLGSKDRPFRVCFAGLLMGTKGAHTLAQALVLLKDRGLHVELSFAGGEFQDGYTHVIRDLLRNNELSDHVHWYGQLSRPQLARFFRLHHAAVFPSIHPEAFGIVAAEAMSSGLLLLSSGVGGAAEIFEDGVSGLHFQANNPASLAARVEQLIKSSPEQLRAMARNGKERIEQKFSVLKSAKKLEQLFQAFSTSSNKA